MLQVQGYAHEFVALSRFDTATTAGLYSLLSTSLILRVLQSNKYFQVLNTADTGAHSVFWTRDTVSTASFMVY